LPLAKEVAARARRAAEKGKLQRHRAIMQIIRSRVKDRGAPSAQTSPFVRPGAWKTWERALSQATAENMPGCGNDGDAPTDCRLIRYELLLRS